MPNMHRARDNVLARKKVLQHSSRDTTVQDLLVMLAGAYEDLNRTNDTDVECTKKLADDVDQMLVGNSELMENIMDDLPQQNEALRRQRLQSTLLEGIGLGVSC